MRVEHEHFRDVVRGKGADIVTLQKGMVNVWVAEAALTGPTIMIGNVRIATWCRPRDRRFSRSAAAAKLEQLLDRARGDAHREGT